MLIYFNVICTLLLLCISFQKIIHFVRIVRVSYIKIKYAYCCMHLLVLNKFLWFLPVCNPSTILCSTCHTSYWYATVVERKVQYINVQYMILVCKGTMYGALSDLVGWLPMKCLNGHIWRNVESSIMSTKCMYRNRESIQYNISHVSAVYLHIIALSTLHK